MALPDLSLKVSLQACKDVCDHQLTFQNSKNIIARAPGEQAKLMRYLWDNYIELSECENVILIGHGSGCQAVVDLVNYRGKLRADLSHIG